MRSPGLFFSDESVLRPWVNSVLTVHTSRGEKKNNIKGQIKGRINFYEVLIFSLKNIPCHFCLPRWTSLSWLQEISCWCWAKKLNCRQMWENSRLHVAATFCILQVPYGKSKYKTVFWHLHILKSFLLYSRVFITEFDGRCLSFRGNAAS